MGEGQIEVSWVASARDLGPPNPALQRPRPAATVSGTIGAHPRRAGPLTFFVRRTNALASPEVTDEATCPMLGLPLLCR